MPATVKKNVDPSESEGWTIILMDRATRFIWEMSCSKKVKKLFLKAMRKLVKMIKKDKDITLVTDGERRYATTLFTICSELRHCISLIQEGLITSKVDSIE